MSVSATPPSWAEGLLRAFLRPADLESVSGDLLEEYRESVYPACGHRGADAWYLRQVLGFGWRSARLWAALFAVAFLSRTAMDWLAPTADFHVRAVVSTILGIGILLLAAFCAAYRSGRFVAGIIIGVATAAIAAAIDAAGTVILLAGWHDPMTMAAIRGSGGLEEAFTLPLMMVFPGILLGTIGGFLGSVAKRVLST
jgi:hypothetical protein